MHWRQLPLTVELDSVAATVRTGKSGGPCHLIIPAAGPAVPVRVRLVSQGLSDRPGLWTIKDRQYWIILRLLFGRKADSSPPFTQTSNENLHIPEGVLRLA
jgi:hypothetical protein